MNSDDLRRDVKYLMVTLAFVTVLLVTMTFKYLRAVDMPQPQCLHPLSFTPTQIEPAKPLDGVGVSI